MGIGFAVPVNTAKKIADQLRSKGKVEHAFLGVTGVAINDTMSQSLNLPTGQGRARAARQRTRRSRRGSRAATLRCR